MVDASDVGLAAALAQSGSTAKQFYDTGYDQGVLDDPNASAALEGAYFSASPNFTNPPPGVKGMVAALNKYGAGSQGDPVARRVGVVPGGRHHDQGARGRR